MASGGSGSFLHVIGGIDLIRIGFSRNYYDLLPMFEPESVLAKVANWKMVSGMTNPNNKHFRYKSKLTMRIYENLYENL